MTEVLKKIVGPVSTQYWFACPGCGFEHAFDDRWQFDGNYESPTVSPSLLVRWDFKDHPTKVCHSFIRNGHIEFLSDCTHHLAGKTVPMVELPEWLKNHE